MLKVKRNFVNIKNELGIYSRERGLRSADVLRVWPLTRSDRYLTDVVRGSKSEIRDFFGPER